MYPGDYFDRVVRSSLARLISKNALSHENEKDKYFTNVGMRVFIKMGTH